MKVAIVHEFLMTIGGAEKVLDSLLKLYPDAKVFTLMYKQDVVDEMQIKAIEASPLQKLPNFFKKRSKFLLPLFPMMVENFNFNEYDLVISSSNSFAHGVITRPDCLHVCYYHSPMRYVWDSFFSYFEEQKFNFLMGYVVKKILHKLRQWDLIASFRPDVRIANSQTVADRILKFYRQDTDAVIFPPVTMPAKSDLTKTEEYALVVSRLSPYKKIDQAILACKKLGLKLKIAGTGQDRDRLEAMADKNVEFLGKITEAKKWELMHGASAFLFPGIDDFGITPVEAMASQTPVVAFAQGGATETVIDQVTGTLYAEQTTDSLAQALQTTIEKQEQFQSKKLRQHAEKFTSSHFESKFKKLINDSISKIST